MCGTGALVEAAEGLRGVLVEEALEGPSGKEGVVVGVAVVFEKVGLAGAAIGPLGSVVAVADRLTEGNPRAYSWEGALGFQAHLAGTDP